MTAMVGEISSERRHGAHGRRPSICYVAPGQHLLDTAGPTRNVLNLASALTDWADVSVAFRRLLGESRVPGVDVLQIEAPDTRQSQAVVDDAAVRGVSITEFLRYMKAVRRSVRKELVQFDLVFEKSWTLSGLVAAECRKVGVPAIVVENLVPVATSGSATEDGFSKRAKIRVGSALAGHYLRNAPRIIAETEILKLAMVDHWRIPPDRISVVPLVIDREVFRPMDREIARQKLGLLSNATVLLYAGVIDPTHSLRAVISAMNRVEPDGVELHVIGDGVLRGEFERLASRSKAVVHFHGRQPYESVPEFIAAADLCLAPYEPAAFPGGQVTYSSLKIPEYMSVGRPVVSVPSGRVLELIEDGVTGFLFANNEQEWIRFLNELPGRDTLAVMGDAAAASELDSWHDAAAAYMEVARSEMEFARHVGEN
jgi:glycosyltransferase involved in cell wall biosynthesis